MRVPLLVLQQQVVAKQSTDNNNAQLPLASSPPDHTEIARLHRPPRRGRHRLRRRLQRHAMEDGMELRLLLLRQRPRRALRRRRVGVLQGVQLHLQLRLHRPPRPTLARVAPREQRPGIALVVGVRRRNEVVREIAPLRYEISPQAWRTKIPQKPRIFFTQSPTTHFFRHPRSSPGNKLLRRRSTFPRGRGSPPSRVVVHPRRQGNNTKENNGKNHAPPFPEKKLKEPRDEKNYWSKG